MIKITETATLFRLLQCIRLLGDLSLNMSGESRVMFKKKPEETFFTHCYVTYSGSQGCIFPLDKLPCAMDEMRKLFTNSDPCVSPNDTEFRQWFKTDAIENIIRYFEDEKTETVICKYIPKGEEDPITVITVSVIINALAISMFEKTKDATFLGEILKTATIKDEENRYTLNVKQKRKEMIYKIDITDNIMLLGISDVSKSRYFYKLNDGTRILSPIRLHGSERAAIVTEVRYAK